MKDYYDTHTQENGNISLRIEPERHDKYFGFLFAENKATVAQSADAFGKTHDNYFLIFELDSDDAIRAVILPRQPEDSRYVFYPDNDRGVIIQDTLTSINRDRFLGGLGIGLSLSMEKLAERDVDMLDGHNVAYFKMLRRIGQVERDLHAKSAIDKVQNNAMQQFLNLDEEQRAVWEISRDPRGLKQYQLIDLLPDGSYVLDHQYEPNMRYLLKEDGWYEQQLDADYHQWKDTGHRGPKKEDADKNQPDQNASDPVRITGNTPLLRDKTGGGCSVLAVPSIVR